ncbi:exported hypothetical protein [Candidatus Sulfotelmatobacter sp. SbA7]|nr:exported hypothetical protein [Candidatus Sulfotelmatobacter sp. SbA7]
MKLRLSTGAALLFVLLAPLAARAELSKQERDTAKSMIAGTLYLRLDVPCRYGRGRWGVAKAIHHVESLLEVSPAGYSAERKLALPGTHKRDSVYWGFSPNDAVRYGKLLFAGDTVQVWMEGVSPHDYEMLVDFIHIQNLDDFTKAFNRTFSKVPLQDEHPEWPAEVRKAIGEHKVIAGMTEEQAFSVVGSPIKVTTGEENGVKSETWVPRQDREFVTSWGQTEGMPTGFPARLEFSGGRLQGIEQTPKGADAKGNQLNEN